MQQQNKIAICTFVSTANSISCPVELRQHWRNRTRNSTGTHCRWNRTSTCIGMYVLQLKWNVQPCWSGTGCKLNRTPIYPASDVIEMIICTLQWRHNGRGGVSNHRHLDCLLDRLFRRRSKKLSKLRVTCPCEGNSQVTTEFPSQRASNTVKVSIWWRHHDFRLLGMNWTSGILVSTVNKIWYMSILVCTVN